MRRPGRDRPVAPGELVRSLCPRLDPGEAAFDGGVDRLVIAQLEMEIGHVLGAAPIAAVKRVRADEVERAGDRAPIAEREDQQDPVGHPLPDHREEGAGEVRAAPFAGPGVLIEFPEGVPMRLREVCAGEVLDGEPRHRRLALLADRLTLAGREGGKEIVERCVAVIGPMKLAVGADQPAGGLEDRHLAFGDEGGVGGGQAVGVDHPLGRGDQRGGERRAARQQPPARHGGERHGDLELGIIIPAGPRPCLGPGMVEHIFALAVALHIGRHQRFGPAVRSVDRDRQRLPAGSRGCASRFLERREKGVGDERIVGTGAAIPIGGVESRHTVDEPGDDRLAAAHAGTS